MLIVMLVLLTTTALAVFAIHATTTEVRAAGYDRMNAQAQEIGESGVTAALTWVDVFGPDSLIGAMAASARVTNASVIPQPFEPPLASGRAGYRLYASDFQRLVDSTSGGATATLTLDSTDLGGVNRLYQPRVVVDIYDDHKFTRPVAGFRSDGNTQMEFLTATYTARGRLRLPTDQVESGIGTHESSSDARARGLSGPF